MKTENQYTLNKANVHPSFKTKKRPEHQKVVPENRKKCANTVRDVINTYKRFFRHPQVIVMSYDNII